MTCILDLLLLRRLNSYMSLYEVLYYSHAIVWSVDVMISKFTGDDWQGS